MKVWLLDEGTPGHTVQTDGIGRILSERMGAETTWIRCRLKLPGWKRSFTRWRVGRAKPETALDIARELYPGLEIQEDEDVDMVISSCGKSAYLNRLLGHRFGVRCLFIGELKPFPSSWFDLILTPVENGVPNEMLVPVIETGRTPEGADAAMRDYWQGEPASGCWTLLIGGASRTHRFMEVDWRRLAEGINTLSTTHGIRWLLSTSRRTGAAAEEILRDRIDPAHLAEAVWWGEAPKKAVGAFLAAGERIFVTQDSLTMMSEALAVGKRAELLCPESWEMPEVSFNGRYVRRLLAEELVGRTSISDLSAYQPAGNGLVCVARLQEEFTRKFLSWVERGSAKS